MNKSLFRGVYPAMITPMTPEGEFNESAYREIIEFNIRSGVDGFWVAGGTGESIFLTDEENNRIAEVSVDQNQGRVKNIMHVGAPTTKRAAKMAEYAASVGVEAICCVPPFFYAPTNEAIVEHLRVVAEAADLPLFVYNSPGFVGYEIMPDLMMKIQDNVPQLEGLKQSSNTTWDIGVYAKMGLSAMVGNSMMMLPALSLGSSGCVDGPLCIVPEIWIEIWDAYNEGDIKRAEVAQALGTDLRRLLLPYTFQSAAKLLIKERLGIDCGSARPPLLPLNAEEEIHLISSFNRFWDEFKSHKQQ